MNGLNYSEFIFQAKRAVGVKRAMLFKKRMRSATQPITSHELFAAKERSSLEKTKDDSEIFCKRPSRGRRLSVPTTRGEVRDVSSGLPVQKYIRPKEPKPTEVKKNKPAGKPKNVKKVTSKIDSGKSVLNRNSAVRSSVKIRRSEPVIDNSIISAKIDNKTPPGFVRRSASVRVSGTTSNNRVKAAADRAHALVESKKAATVVAAATAATSPGKKTHTKVGDSIRSKATAKVDSRRGSASTPTTNSAQV